MAQAAAQPSMRDRHRFAGKTVFITGGGSGIGEAAARLFAEEGGNIVVVDINEPDAARVAEALPSAISIGLDVSIADAVAAAIDTTVDHFGQVDVIFNNAGIAGKFEPFHETSLDNWRRVTAVNGDGMFHVLRFGIASMLRTGGGAIVNTTSVAGLCASGPDLGPYIYSKTGVIGLTRAAASDYAGRNIRVNAVAPGQVLTPLIEGIIAAAPDPEAERRHRGNRHPMPGFITPADIAAAVAFLASDDARWITGTVLPVDGGYLAR